jgi:hypothetical protein
LVQCGGGQNTINNTVANAPFPIGAVVTHLGHTEIVVAEGSLTAPGGEGTYTLSISGIFANAISLVQPDGIDFYVVEEVTPVVGENLEIVVTSAPCSLVDTTPPNCAIDARQPSEPNGSNPAGWTSIDLTFEGTCGVAGLGAGDVTVTSTGVAPGVADVSTAGSIVTIEFDGIIPAVAWTCVEVIGHSACIGSLPGDVSNDRTSAPGDILHLIDCLNGVRVCEIFQCDSDRSNVCGPPDILRTIDLLNGASTYVPFLNVSIPVCPN